MALPSNQQLMQGILNGMIPKEGPKTVPIKVDLRATLAAIIDLSTQNDLGQLSFIQSVFIDNTGNGSPFLLTVEGSGQVIQIGPGQQGYLPLLAPLPNKFTAATAGGVQVPLFFLNVPMPAAVWDKAGVPAFNFSGGNLLVSDVALDALIADKGAGPGLGVNVLTGGSSGASGLPPVFSSFTSGANPLQLVAVPPANKFQVTGVRVTIDPQAFNATFPGMYGWSVNQGTTAALKQIASGPIMVPATGFVPTAIQDGEPIILYESPPGMLYTSDVAGDDYWFHSNILTLPGAWGGFPFNIVTNFAII